MDWDNTTKRYGLACFESSNPPDIEAEGDASQEFDSLDEAQAWATKAIQAGRFKYMVLWDGSSGEWEWQEDFRPAADADD